MSDKTLLTAEEAIEKGFEYFEKFVRGTKKSHILLEGLELSSDDTQWIVTIGFDIGRIRTDAGSFGTMLPGRGREPIREFSEIFINAVDGSFVKLGQ